MGFKVEVSIAIWVIIGVVASADLTQDRTECANQLAGLAPCLPYVSGEAKQPVIDCCTGLKQVLEQSQKCLCILIKDRDDPNLGLKINATLAATLPSSCHAPANVTDCINILHLAPSSPDAKIFKEFANITAGSGKSTSASVTSGNSSASGSGSTAPENSGANWSWSWSWSWTNTRASTPRMICGLLLWAFW